MPLIKRQPFKRNPPPKDLGPDDEVFYCVLTKEIFRHYDEFFTRHILLNSLVWTCAQTGRSGLTFEEAQQSEKQALDALDHFPKRLRKPLLHIVSHTRRGRIDDIVSDIWNFTKERYLIGEDVEVSDKSGSGHVAGRVVGVNYNSGCDLSLQGSHSGKKNREEMKAVPATVFRYDVQVGKNIEKDILPQNISRPKAGYNKVRLKLFLKSSCDVINDCWANKPSAVELYHLNEVKFSDVFAGPAPEFPRTPMTKKGTQSVKTSIENELSLLAAAEKSSKKSQKSPKSPKKLTKEFIKAKEKQMEELKIIVTSARTVDMSPEIVNEYTKCDADKLIDAKKLNELKNMIKIKREEDRERKREERRVLEEKFREWRRPRDDLQCDDLGPFPQFPPLAPLIDQTILADILALHMFFHSWWDFLELEGVSLSKEQLTLTFVIESLTNQDTDGPLVEIFQALLQTVFGGQESEDGDEISLDQKEELAVENCDLDNKRYSEAIKNAIITAEQARDTFGVSIRNLHLDGLCISEVLRLHIQSSGYYTGSNTARFRYCNRGGFRCWDDYGLLFRKAEPGLMIKLETHSIFELELGDKLKLVNLLCDQSLTFNKFRTELDCRLEKVEQLKRDIKQLRIRDLVLERESCMNKQLRDTQITVAKLRETNPDAADKMEAECNLPPRVKPSKYTKRLRTLLQNMKEGSVSSGRRPPFLSDDGMDVLAEVRFNELELDEIVFVRELQRERVEQEHRRLNQLLLNTHMHIGQNVLLGRDRAFRKYYLDMSLPAILIESAEESIGECQEQTPLDKVAYPEDLPINTEVGYPLIRNRILGCSGHTLNCSVHSKLATQYSWSYVNGQENWSLLLKGLNQRGFRESELLVSIENFKYELEMVVSKEMNLGQVQLSPIPTSDESQVQGLVREKLLECEEEMSLGGMGNLPARESWRDAVTNTKEVCVIAKALLELANAFNLNFITGLYATKNEDERVEPTDNFLLWKSSVVKCTSYSQIAVHLSSFDSAIEWKKSKLKQRCRICRKKGESNNMALCCKCSLTTHTYCLKPSIYTIPQNWKCPECTKQEKARERREQAKLVRERELAMREKHENKQTNGVDHKRKVKLEYTDMFDASSSENSSDQSDDDSLIVKRKSSNRCADCHGGLHLDKSSWVQCKQCAKCFHCACVSLNKRGNSSWTCRKCPSSETSDHSQEEDVYENKSSRKRKKTYEEKYVNGALHGGDIKRKRVANAFDRRKTIDDDFVSDETTKALMLGLRGDKAARQREFSLCQQLIDEAMRHDDSWPFDKPVNRNEVPDYYKVISEPMDLGTMINKLKRHDYESTQQVVHDYKTIFSNCRVYNQPNTEIYKCGESLEEYMDTKLIELGLDANLVKSVSASRRRKTR